MTTSGFDEKVAYAKEKLRELNDTVHVKVDINNGTLRQIAQDTEAIHRMMGKNQAILERVNLDDSDAKIRLAELTRDRSVRVNVKVNKSDLNQAESLFSKVGGLFGGGHSFNLPFTSMTANPAGLAAIGGAIAALVPELVGVVSGFAAAGAGAGAFAALAAPAVKSVSTAYSNLSAAQKAYNAAKEKEKLDPSKTNAAALVKAADNLKLVREQISQMPAAEQAGITGITNLSTAFHKMSKAFEPKAFEVFSSGLRLTASLLPHLTPFANTFADSLSKIFNNLDKSSKGKGFQDFLKSFHGIEGPALNAIGAGIGNVAGSVGRLLTVMSGKDVAHTLNIAFSGISGTIGGITASVKFLMNAFDGMKQYGHNIAAAFDSVRHAAAGLGDSIKGGLMSLLTSPKTITAKIVGWFSGVPGQIKALFSGSGGWLLSAGSNILHGLESGAKSAWAGLNGWLGGIPGKLKGDFSGAAGWLVSAGENVIQGLINGLNSKLGALSGVISHIAGIVKSVAGFLGIHSPSTVMFGYGVNIAQGLAMGMVSGTSGVQQAAGMLAGAAMGGGSGSHGSGAALGGVIEVHSHVHLDGRELFTSVQRSAVTTQRRTGHSGLGKRTR